MKTNTIHFKFNNSFFLIIKSGCSTKLWRVISDEGLHTIFYNCKPFGTGSFWIGLNEQCRRRRSITSICNGSVVRLYIRYNNYTRPTACTRPGHIGSTSTATSTTKPICSNCRCLTAERNTCSTTAIPARSCTIAIPASASASGIVYNGPGNAIGYAITTVTSDIRSSISANLACSTSTTSTDAAV